MKNVLETIKNIIKTLIIFSIFFIVLRINIESGYVFPYTIFKALGWSALLYGIYIVVSFVYFSLPHKSEEKENNLRDAIYNVAFIIGGLILLLIGGVFLNICY